MIRTTLALLLLGLSATPLASAALETFTIHSAALAANLTGDSPDQTVTVYLPPSYSHSTTRRYPVVFLLHGLGDTSEVWAKYFHVVELLDDLMAHGAIAEMIVVMPNAKNRLLGSYYANSPVTGNWEDYIAQEVVARVDHDFRTLPKSSSRGLVGHSMGGFGAIRLAMHRPDVFAVVYAMSPCCLDMPWGGEPAEWKGFLQLKTYDDADASVKRGEFYPVAALGLLSAVDPNPSAPLHVNIPVRIVGDTLVPIESAYTEFRERLPLQQIARYRDNLLKLRAFAFDYGFEDQFAHIPPATSAFSKALNDAHVPHTLETYTGDHREFVHDRLSGTVLPFLSRNLQHE